MCRLKTKENKKKDSSIPKSRKKFHLKHIVVLILSSRKYNILLISCKFMELFPREQPISSDEDEMNAELSKNQKMIRLETTI